MDSYEKYRIVAGASAGTGATVGLRGCIHLHSFPLYVHLSNVECSCGLLLNRQIEDIILTYG